MSAPTFWKVRAEIEGAARSLKDKRLTAREAIRLVRDGDHVAVGGCLYSRTPMALVFELIRQGRAGLTLSRCLTCYEGELLLAADGVERIVTSWMGIGMPWGISKILRHVVENRLAAYEEWSHLGIGLRYKAGAMGVPFLPTTSMLGSDLVHHTSVKEMDCPFTGRRLCLVPALLPDVALIHVHRADRYGNIQIDGYSHMDVDIARAARRVIVSAEEIVASEEIANSPDRTLLPHFVVDAVVEEPFGAYPHECYGLYDADYEHFDDYVASVKESGIVGVKKYITEHVTGTASFEEFLDRYPPSRFTRLRRRARRLLA